METLCIPTSSHTSPPSYPSIIYTQYLPIMFVDSTSPLLPSQSLSPSSQTQSTMPSLPLFTWQPLDSSMISYHSQYYAHVRIPQIVSPPN